MTSTGTHKHLVRKQMLNCYGLESRCCHLQEAEFVRNTLKKSIFVINIKKSNWQPRDEIICLGIKNRLIKTVLCLIAENRLLSIKKLI